MKTVKLNKDFREKLRKLSTFIKKHDYLDQGKKTSAINASQTTEVVSVFTASVNDTSKVELEQKNEIQNVFSQDD